MEANNMAAMREALLVVKRLFDGGIMFQPAIRKAHKAVDAALAAPPRNCDEGTAEEQVERFRKFCKMDYISEDCPDDCPLYRKDYSTSHCPFAWAQMPYEEGGAK